MLFTTFGIHLAKMFREEMRRGQMLALCAALTGGLALAALAGPAMDWWRTQQDAGEAVRAGTLRLHIRADSDSVLDQTCKLAVRDALLELTDRLCADAGSADEARAAAARGLPAYRLTARETLARLGVDRPVRVSLVNMYFDTTRYEGFTLPAGRYDAVRVDIGGPDSYGRNWWCVLYPGLCGTACGGYDDPAETDLVCGDYILRLRVVEWWQQLTAARADRTLLALP